MKHIYLSWIVESASFLASVSEPFILRSSTLISSGLSTWTNQRVNLCYGEFDIAKMGLIGMPLLRLLRGPFNTGTHFLMVLNACEPFRQSIHASTL